MDFMTRPMKGNVYDLAERRKLQIKELRLLLHRALLNLYRVIHKSLRDFRTRLRNNQDRHGRKEQINR